MRNNGRRLNNKMIIMKGKSLKTLLSSLGAFALIAGAWFSFGDKGKTESGAESKLASGDKISVADAPASKLAIMANRCRGCGKCVRADSEHFALDVENRTAIIISTENLDSENLAEAVRACHENAIIIS